MVNLIATTEKKFDSVPEARDYLRSRDIKAFTCSASRMRFAIEDNVGILRIKGINETRDFPIRETGMSTILAKTGMGQGSFPYDVCDNDLLAFNLNYLFSHNVADKTFKVIIENGQLKALMTNEYSLVNHEHILDIIEGAKVDYKIHQLSLTKDHFRACITNPANVATINVNDISSVGVDILNSENGCASLILGQYVYRYWCKNGASRVDESQSIRSKAIHRGQNIYRSLENFKSTANYYLVNGAAELERNFKLLSEKPVTESFLRNVVDKVQIAIGKKSGEVLIDEWEKSIGKKVCEDKEWQDKDYTKYQDNRYDFAQLITKSAHRDYNGAKRLNMEKIGGYIYHSGATLN